MPESDQDRAKRLAERKRVDDKYNKGRAEIIAKKPQKTKTYPAAISAMGTGFQNLYDALGGNQ